MRLRMGLLVGFGIGYYFGAMAGRERYLQLNRMMRRAGDSDVAEAAADKAKSAVDVGYNKAKETVSDKLHHNGATQTSQYTPS